VVTLEGLLHRSLIALPGMVAAALALGWMNERQ